MKNYTLIFTLALIFTIKTAAQTPVFIPAESKFVVQNHPENNCNFAGTIQVGAFIGQSNDTDLDTIFLCLGDSISINHLGDADLSGDPNATTVPGIAYAFYRCPPTVSGPSLQDILGDSCLLEGAIGGLFVTQGVQNGGDTWFVNNGLLQTIFNSSQPIQIPFAPISLDNFAFNEYEYAQVGGLPGPCVNVNTDAVFDVIYLNQIKVSDIDNNSGDDCLGSFSVRGGLPEFNGSTYQIDISLTSNPAIPAQVLTLQGNLVHGVEASFSVFEPGIYTINIEDGKSCGHTFFMDMSGCSSIDNLVMDVGEVASSPGSQVCVPVRLGNFTIASAAFSVNWDPALLKFTGINQLNPAISHFFNLNTFVNSGQAGAGKLGIILFDSWNLGAAIVIPDGESLFDLCFELLDTTSENCIPVWFNNTPSQISLEDPAGKSLGLSLFSGGICKSVGITDFENITSTKLFPNPVNAGEPVFLNMSAKNAGPIQVSLKNIAGHSHYSRQIDLQQGANEVVLSTEALPPGVYFATLKGVDGVILTCKLLVFK